MAGVFQFQDMTDAPPCHIHLPVFLWVMDSHSRASKEKYKPWRWGATASITKTMSCSARLSVDTVRPSTVARVQRTDGPSRPMSCSCDSSSSSLPKRLLCAVIVSISVSFWRELPSTDVKTDFFFCQSVLKKVVRGQFKISEILFSFYILCLIRRPWQAFGKTIQGIFTISAERASKSQYLLYFFFTLTWQVFS